MRHTTSPSLVSRRQAVRALAAAAAGLAVLANDRASGAETRTAQAPGAPTPHLDVKDPAAIALGYVEDAAKVDAKKNPSYTPGSSCENCLQLQGAAGAAYRPCTLFPGKLVATTGWCSAWTAEM
jgi:hypothetical protein